VIAEITLIISTLNSLNKGMATLSETKKNLSGLTDVFSVLTQSKEAVVKIEQGVEEGTQVLSQEEALKLAWIREDIKKKERALKRATPPAVWRDMLMLQHKSLSKIKETSRRQAVAVAKQRQMYRSIAGGIVFWICLAMAGYIALRLSEQL